MKKLLFIAITTCFVACVSKQTVETAPEATIPNYLMNAIDGESNASAKYALISNQAIKQGELGIAAMFAAASAAEAIHVKNHTAVLAEMGENFENEVSPEITENFEENIKSAIDGETYEFTEMYPPMIALADKEAHVAALKTFTFAKKAEERHAMLYHTMLQLWQNGQSSEIHAVWYVCPECGNLFNTLEGYEICAICGFNKTTFIPFEK